MTQPDFLSRFVKCLAILIKKEKGVNHFVVPKAAFLISKFVQIYSFRLFFVNLKSLIFYTADYTSELINIFESEDTLRLFIHHYNSSITWLFSILLSMEKSNR